MNAIVKIINEINSQYIVAALNYKISEVAGENKLKKGNLRDY